MKLPTLFSLLLAHCWAFAQVLGQQQWPIHDNGLNKVVQWDRYSYIINGQRLFIWSGEMHYWRAPVPEIWIDIIQKVKAAGFNTISYYGNWAYHSAKDGQLDFETGAHNFESLFTLAQEAGLYVLWRPGPYINAETSAGGFPGWLTTGDYGTLRNNDTRYTTAWTPFMTKMAQVVSKHLITNGGNVFIYQIENEYGNQWRDSTRKIPNYPAIDYMQKLQDNARAGGIDVPLIANNPNMRTKSWSKDFSNEGGNVDNYGLDHYPSCWSCNLTECSGTNGNVPDFTTFDYFSNFQEVAPTQPSFLAEFQGGSYLPWGGPRGGCVNNTGPNWVNVYYRHNVAQKVTAMNVYMVFGGTSWGGLPYPNVGASYDYSAPIGESRVIASKYQETKLFGLFTRAARDLTKVERVGNSSLYASTPDIYTTELRNVDTNSGFYVTIHTSSPSTAITPFKLKVSTSEGNFTIPQQGGNIVLNGRQSKIIVTDFKIGQEKLIYSTAEILAVSIIDGKPLTVLWLPTGESGEFLLTGAKNGTISKQSGCPDLALKADKAGTIVSWTQAGSSCVVKFENGYRFVLADRALAYKTWVPSFSKDPYTPENSTIVVHGSYLIRTAALAGPILKLEGDWTDDTDFEVYAPEIVRRVQFNGKDLRVNKTPQGSWISKLNKPRKSAASIQESLPKLVKWKVKDGLPEKDSKYDDSKWVVANKNSTNNPTKPATYPVLYASDYGFHTGNILWRGRFAAGNAAGVYISVFGGTSHGWSAYLNGKHIGTWAGSNAVTQGSLTLTFPNTTAILPENTLLILQDHMGKDQTSGATNPRGVYNVTLIPSATSSSPSVPLTFTSWHVTGNAGGESNIDPVRGILNEGGLHGERLGWHLPRFPDQKWERGAPDTGFTEEGGLRFYRTVVDLDLPRGVDVSLGFELSSGFDNGGGKVRAQLYVNGYLFGKYIPHIGNQIVFPVFPGILNYHGSNTIALSIWSLDNKPASVSVKWTVLGVVESSFDPGFKADYLRPSWKDRSQWS